MPSIIYLEDMNIINSDAGWSMRTVAEASHIGFPAMVARWWTFQPGVQGPSQTRSTAEEMLYVIQGSGRAIVDGQTFELDEESVLWVEEGETYYFIAGKNGLEVLQGYAPGEANNE
jgi:quercetin dioxygenase-like cupin family protein